jgi:spore maturation protein CgeB
VGACLLTDWKNNLKELFVPEQEVVTYKSVDECVEKVKWLLGHPQERQMIARAGQARTLKDHTFTHRAVQLDKIIKSL